MRNSGHASCRVVDISHISETVAHLQTKLGTPQTILHDPLAQGFRVDRYRLLQPSDFATRVVQWNADSSLAQIDYAAKTVGRLLIKIMMPYASARFLDNGFDLVQVPIDKIHLSTRCLNPGTSVHPPSPSVEVCDGRHRSRYTDAIRDRSQVLHGKRRGLTVVQSDVDVGLGSSEAQGV